MSLRKRIRRVAQKAQDVAKSVGEHVQSAAKRVGGKVQSVAKRVGGKVQDAAKTVGGLATEGILGGSLGALGLPAESDESPTIPGAIRSKAARRLIRKPMKSQGGIGQISYTDEAFE